MTNHAPNAYQLIQRGAIKRIIHDSIDLAVDMVADMLCDPEFADENKTFEQLKESVRTNAYVFVAQQLTYVGDPDQCIEKVPTALKLAVDHLVENCLYFNSNNSFRYIGPTNFSDTN